MENKDDIVGKLGYVALATRLKRISDKMSHSARQMYRDLEIEMEPNWYLVLLLARDKPVISIMEIASSLGFTHQSVDIITKKMMKVGYLRSMKDERDKRKSVFYLTDKGIGILPLIGEVWKEGAEAITEILNDDLSILNHIEIIEQNLLEQSFGNRIKKKLESNEKFTQLSGNT